MSLVFVEVPNANADHFLRWEINWREEYRKVYGEWPKDDKPKEERDNEL